MAAILKQSSYQSHFHDSVATLAEELFQEFRGSKTFNVVLRGDTNAWMGPLLVVAIGSVPPQQCWRRDTAQPGDLLIVTAHSR